MKTYEGQTAFPETNLTAAMTNFVQVVGVTLLIHWSIELKLVSIFTTMLCYLNLVCLMLVNLNSVK